MPVTTFTSRVKNAGKRNRMSAVMGGVEEKKLPPPSYIICCTADWCMFVPRWEIFTPPHVWGFRVHFSTRQTRFNKHSNHKHRLIRYQKHSCSPYTVHLHAILEPKHTYEAKKKCMYAKKPQKRPQQCKRANENKKSCSQTALSFNQWEVQNYACKKTEMLKSKITLCNIPGH